MSTVDWQPIETHPMPKTEQEAWTWDAPSVLVDNGERVGEAELKQDYGSWDDDESFAPFRWAWTHRSTCSCCHGFMKPQPTHWAPMPKRNPE